MRLIAYCPRLNLTVILASAACLLACTPEPEGAPIALDLTLPAPAALAPAPEPASQVAPKTHHGLAWFEDDAPAALSHAQAQNKPLFVDLWAPWCHTCLSMREYVLRADTLPQVAEQFVFLAINTEKPENAEFLRAIPVQAWPTFYVLQADGNKPQIRGRWVGAASPQQLMLFLRDATHAIEAAKAGGLPKDDPLALTIAGDRLFAEGKLEAAAAQYAEALARARPDWPRRPDTLVARISLLYKLKQLDACVDLGLSEMERTGSAASAADFAYYALSCASELKTKDARVTKVRRSAEQKLRALCEVGSTELTADDRSDACASLRTVHEALKNKAGMKTAAHTRLTVLEAASRGVPDDVALTYDWARAETLLWLARGNEALAFLEARERALPSDYNPAHYLARVHKELGRTEEALLAFDRAIDKAYGPRRASMIGAKAELLLSANRKEDAKRAFEEQLNLYAALPEGQKNVERVEAMRERLANWR